MIFGISLVECTFFSGSKADASNDYERQFGKECNSLAIGTYTDLIYAFKVCEHNSQCNFIFDEYCDEKSKFSLCRTIKESKSGSCVYKKRKLFFYCNISKRMI